jgi:hypothetical protein
MKISFDFSNHWETIAAGTLALVSYPKMNLRLPSRLYLLKSDR